jgi:cobalt-zinc-cadmium efflux system outer membrane protein
MMAAWKNQRTWGISAVCPLVVLCLWLPANARCEEDAPAREAAAYQPVTLEQLIDLAKHHHPDLAIARARVDAARGHLMQAGLYPNPTFTWEGEDMNAREHGSGAQGPIIGQQIITAKKRKIAQAAAAEGVSFADWQAVSRWYDVLTRVRTAYFDLLTVQREVQTLQEAVRISQEGLDAARKVLKAGTGTKPDELRALVELEQSRTQLRVAEQRQEAAWRMLAAVVGLRELPGTKPPAIFDTVAPTYEWEPVLQAVLSGSSLVQEAQTAVQQADEELRLARANKYPNVDLSVRPFHSYPERRFEVTVMVGAALPIYDRNQGNIHTAEANVLRTHEEVRQIELRLQERLTTAFQRYLSARRQVEAYEKTILPNARESLKLIRIGYEAGDPKYDYTTVLQSQQTLIQARLQLVQAEGELWRAVSDIAGLLQQDCFAAKVEAAKE